MFDRTALPKIDETGEVSRKRSGDQILGHDLDLAESARTRRDAGRAPSEKKSTSTCSVQAKRVNGEKAECLCVVYKCLYYPPTHFL